MKRKRVALTLLDRRADDNPRTRLQRVGTLARGTDLPPPASMDPLPALPAEPLPGLYRHYKGGAYEVLGLARHSETLGPMVVYRALYGERGLWVRPAGMWTEEVEVGGGKVARFTRESSA